MPQKPFLKWVGGKTQILSDILSTFPTTIRNYYEPFLGGGSVLLGLLSSNIIIKGGVYTYDANPSLIWTFKHIQTNPDGLWTFIDLYMKKYDSITGEEINRNPDGENAAMGSKESYYYWLRKQFNQLDKTTLECAAIFMIINKTCFRGMYREGPNGYNVPYGHYKKTPTITTLAELKAISKLIEPVVFECRDFRESLGVISGDGDGNGNGDDFVYLDPPYVPVDVKSFVKYTADGFDLETHKKLFDEIVELNKKKIRFVLSNAKVDMVVNYFNEFNIEELVARRAIHSKNPNSTAVEVIITN